MENKILEAAPVERACSKFLANLNVIQLLEQFYSVSLIVKELHVES